MSSYFLNKSNSPKGLAAANDETTAAFSTLRGFLMGRLIICLALVACTSPFVARNFSPQLSASEKDLSSPFIYVWSQVSAGGLDARHVEEAKDLEIRAITRASDCPEDMKLRAAPSAAFPVTVCTKNVGRDELHRSRFGDASIQIPSIRTAKSAYIIGDTGCKNSGQKGQDCDNAWPLAQIAATMATATPQPELFIHMGDYVYRNNSRDTWANWEQEFFAPLKDLLAKAPWLFLRGNHEACKSANAGYRRFLDPWPYKEECEDVSGAYRLEALGGTQFLVVDSSDAQDLKRSAEAPDRRARYKKTASKLRTQFQEYGEWIHDRGLKDSSWVLTHRPAWACAPYSSKDSTETACSAGGYLLREKVLQQLRGEVLSNMNYFVFGHVHHFSMTSFADKAPLQIVVGNGGAKLNPQYGSTAVNTQTAITDGSHPVGKSFNVAKFGYGKLTNIADKKWKLSLSTFSATGVASTPKRSFIIEAQDFSEVQH